MGGTALAVAVTLLLPPPWPGPELDRVFDFADAAGSEPATAALAAVVGRLK